MSRKAFNTLKMSLCEVVKNPLDVIDTSIPLTLSIDASNFAMGACLTQTMDGQERPVAFASSKLGRTQQNWATVEKQVCTTISASQKLKHCIF
jgi:hypothetical protein